MFGASLIPRRGESLGMRLVWCTVLHGEWGSNMLCKFSSDNSTQLLVVGRPLYSLVPSLWPAWADWILVRQCTDIMTDCGVTLPMNHPSHESPFPWVTFPWVTLPMSHPSHESPCHESPSHESPSHESPFPWITLPTKEYSSYSQKTIDLTSKELNVLTPMN